MSDPDRTEICKFAANVFAVARDRILREYAEREKSVLAQVKRTGNSGAYVPALANWATDRLREMILAKAESYAKAFAKFKLLPDDQVVKAIEAFADETAAGSISGMLGHYHLIARRKKLPPGEAGGHLTRAINHAKRLALDEAKLILQGPGRKTNAEHSEVGRVEMPNSGSTVGIPTRHLSAIRADQERRTEAQKDLKHALQNYTSSLSRPQETDLNALAEIWGQFAVALYDSLAESFMGMPVSLEATFGEAGVLAGGQTLEDVQKAIKSVRVPRPDHWPLAPTSRGPEDDPKMALVRELMFSDVSFRWLLDEPWFRNEIRDRVGECVREWKEASTKMDRLQAISDFGASVKKISPASPDYKVWEAFCLGNHKIEGRWVSEVARRALRGKPLDPKGAHRFVLNLFDTAVEAQVALVKDSESAAGCEAQLMTLAHGSLDYLEDILTQVGQSEQINKWRRNLELGLVERLGKAKVRALDAAAGNRPAGIARRRASVSPRRATSVPKTSTDRRNAAMLRGADGNPKRVVTVGEACRYGGVGQRAIQKACKKGSLQSEGDGPNRRIVVQSLLNYYPPENNPN